MFDSLNLEEGKALLKDLTTKLFHLTSVRKCGSRIVFEKVSGMRKIKADKNLQKHLRFQCTKF